MFLKISEKIQRKLKEGVKYLVRMGDLYVVADSIMQNGRPFFIFRPVLSLFSSNQK